MLMLLTDAFGFCIITNINKLLTMHKRTHNHLAMIYLSIFKVITNFGTKAYAVVAPIL